MKYSKRYALLVTIFCLFAAVFFYAIECGDKGIDCFLDCSLSTECCEFDFCAFDHVCAFENRCFDEIDALDCGRNPDVCCEFEDCADDFDCVCVDEDGFLDCGFDLEFCCADVRCFGEPFCVTALFRISVNVITLNRSEETTNIVVLGSGMSTDNQSLTRQTEDIGQAVELRPGQAGSITLTDVTAGDVFWFGASFRGKILGTADCEFTGEFIEQRDPEVIWDGRFLSCNVW